MNDEFLTSLLADKDDVNASLAMRQILNNDECAAYIREKQDASEPLLRKRIQQLAVIRNQEWLEQYLPENIDKSFMGNWEVLACINACIDKTVSITQLQGIMVELVSCRNSPIRNMGELVGMLQELQIQMEPGDDFFVSCLLLQDVMIHRTGDEYVVATIAQSLAEYLDWETKLGYLNGKLAVADKHGTALLPGEDWKEVQCRNATFTPLSKRELAKIVLTRLYAASSIDQLSSMRMIVKRLLNSLFT